MMPRSLWAASIAAAVVGTALVFASVTVAGLFRPGVLLLDVGLLLALAAAVLQLRPTRPETAR